MKVFAIISAIIAGLMFLIFWAVGAMSVKDKEKQVTEASSVLMFSMGVWLITAICLAVVA